MPDINSLLEDMKASPPATEEDLRAALETHGYALAPMGEADVDAPEEAPEEIPEEAPEEAPLDEDEQQTFSGPFNPSKRMSAIRKNLGGM